MTTRPPRTVWLTGLPGSGKSTLAALLSQTLATRNRTCVVLDGDALRSGMCRDLGFSDADRTENIRRAAEMAALLNRAGLDVVAALVSPKDQDRALARRIIGAQCMVEVHVATPLSLCELRDPKGLYARARRGDLPGLTGLGSPYEEPQQPELRIDTSGQSPAQCVDRILPLLGL